MNVLAIGRARRCWSCRKKVVQFPAGPGSGGAGWPVALIFLGWREIVDRHRT